ncbi:MAG: hypothetical protein ABL927_06200, partial [Bdellovibrionales bacterium]
MKELLISLQGFARELMGKIEKNEIPVCSANGIKLSKVKGHSYEEAQQIEKKYLDYKRESQQYWRDETKIVLPKRMFLKTMNSRFYNLFLFEHLNSEAKTRIDFGDTVKDAAKKTPSLFLIFILGIFSAVIFLVGICFLIQPSFVAAIVDDGDRIISIALGIVFLYFSVILCLACRERFQKRKSIKLAKLVFPKLTGPSFFSSSTDQSCHGDLDSYPWNTVMFFEQVPDYSEMAYKSISFKGKMGYLILKTSKVDSWVSTEKEISIRYWGPLLPVIIMEETIIFDVSYLHVFSETDPFLGNRELG